MWVMRGVAFLLRRYETFCSSTPICVLVVMLFQREVPYCVCPVSCYLHVYAISRDDCVYDFDESSMYVFTQVVSTMLSLHLAQTDINNPVPRV